MARSVTPPPLSGRLGGPSSTHGPLRTYSRKQASRPRRDPSPSSSSPDSEKDMFDTSRHTQEHTPHREQIRGRPQRRSEVHDAGPVSKSIGRSEHVAQAEQKSNRAQRFSGIERSEVSHSGRTSGHHPDAMTSHNSRKPPRQQTDLADDLVRLLNEAYGNESACAPSIAKPRSRSRRLRDENEAPDRQLPKSDKQMHSRDPGTVTKHVNAASSAGSVMPTSKAPSQLSKTGAHSYSRNRPGSRIAGSSLWLNAPEPGVDDTGRRVQLGKRYFVGAKPPTSHNYVSRVTDKPTVTPLHRKEAPVTSYFSRLVMPQSDSGSNRKRHDPPAAVHAQSPMISITQYAQLVASNVASSALKGQRVGPPIGAPKVKRASLRDDSISSADSRHKRAERVRMDAPVAKPAVRQTDVGQQRVDGGPDDESDMEGFVPTQELRVGLREAKSPYGHPPKRKRDQEAARLTYPELNEAVKPPPRPNSSVVRSSGPVTRVGSPVGTSRGEHRGHPSGGEDASARKDTSALEQPGSVRKVGPPRGARKETSGPSAISNGHAAGKSRRPDVVQSSVHKGSTDITNFEGDGAATASTLGKRKAGGSSASTGWYLDTDTLEWKRHPPSDRHADTDAPVLHSQNMGRDLGMRSSPTPQSAASIKPAASKTSTKPKSIPKPRPSKTHEMRWGPVQTADDFEPKSGYKDTLEPLRDSSSGVPVDSSPDAVVVRTPSKTRSRSRSRVRASSVIQSGPLKEVAPLKDAVPLKEAAMPKNRKSASQPKSPQEVEATRHVAITQVERSEVVQSRPSGVSLSKQPGMAQVWTPHVIQQSLSGSAQLPAVTSKHKAASDLSANLQNPPKRGRPPKVTVKPKATTTSIETSRRESQAGLASAQGNREITLPSPFTAYGNSQTAKTYTDPAANPVAVKSTTSYHVFEYQRREYLCAELAQIASGFVPATQGLSLRFSGCFSELVNPAASLAEYTRDVIIGIVESSGLCLSEQVIISPPVGISYNYLISYRCACSRLPTIPCAGVVQFGADEVKGGLYNMRGVTANILVWH